MSTTNQFDRTPKPQQLDEKAILLAKEQQETGLIMDACVKREMFLQRNKEQIFGDDSLMLYRLPLTESQMKDVHASLCN
tara:strand:+ start:4276 stop:4512 length:237 start_codon:yes stop_codon:yes gene_type:complete